MTENLAGRGEGLAGLVAKLRDIGDALRASVVAESFARGREIHQICDDLAALEAAAPPSTAHALNLEQLRWLEQLRDEARAIAKGRRDCEWANYRANMADEILAALATPSPQAPDSMDAQAKLGTVNSVGAGASRGSLRDERFESAPCSDSDLSIHEAAATQEPAGSGASELHPVERFSKEFQAHASNCYQCWNWARVLRPSESGFKPCNEGDKLVHFVVGSPRKVGEDALAEEVSRLRAALEPFAAFGRYLMEHPRMGLGDALYGWDNEVFLRQSDLLKAASAARPSSAPVGEQK